MYIRSHNHGTATTIGYRVVRALTPEGVYRREIVHTVPGANRYGVAVDDKNRRMDNRQGREWFVIDVVYACGCVHDEYVNDDPIIPIPEQPRFTAEDARHAFALQQRLALHRNGERVGLASATVDASLYAAMVQRAAG